MRLFVYKSLFIFFCILITFKLTIGSLLKDVETRISQIKSKENIVLIKDKIREEVRGSLNKDQILNTEDAILLKKFLVKINSELQNAN